MLQNNHHKMNNVKLQIITVPEEIPEWVSYYYMNTENDNEYKCNICETYVNTKGKPLEKLNHIKDNHSDVIMLHKNPDDSVGFHIEFLQLNVLKDDGDPKNQPVIIGEVCEAHTEEEKPNTLKSKEKDYAVMKKKRVSLQSMTRKRSWVWKYFKKLSNFIFRCELCNVVLSIKGFNTNNMNRHIRSKHPVIYESETAKKQDDTIISSLEDKKDETSTDVLYLLESQINNAKTQRRSWVWEYFTRESATLARCKICQRNICHGGNATGNMNRHLKMIHLIKQPKSDFPNISDLWVWKVFEDTGDNFYTCKICQFKCTQYSTMQQSITSILTHLDTEHGVVSGDQIITSTDADEALVTEEIC